MKKLAIMIILLLGTIAPGTTLAQTKSTFTYKMAVETICSGPTNLFKKVFVDKRHSIPAKEIVKFRLTLWKNSLARGGVTPYLSPQHHKYMNYIVYGILSGRWGSPEEMSLICRKGGQGDVFPPFEYAQLKKTKKWYEKQGRGVEITRNNREVEKMLDNYK